MQEVIRDRATIQREHDSRIAEVDRGVRNTMSTTATKTLSELRVDVIMATFKCSRTEAESMGTNVGIGIWVVCRTCGESISSDIEITDEHISKFPPSPWREVRPGEFYCSERCERNA